MTRPLAAGYALTSVGRVRAFNEDAWYAGEHLFVVADGMGGHEAGDVASAVTIEHLAALDRPPGEWEGTRREVVGAVLAANAAVLDHSRVHPEAAGLGSTVCGLLRTLDRWLVFNAGDSRCYVVGAGVLRQLTVDHSEVQELVDQQVITREEARIHPGRNVITRAVGQLPPPVVDVFEAAASTGSRFLLASDGLSSEIDDAEIAALCAAYDDPSDLAQALVRAAEDAGGRDNVTVIVVDDLGAVSAPLARAQKTTTVPRDLIVREVAQ